MLAVSLMSKAAGVVTRESRLAAMLTLLVACGGALWSTLRSPTWLVTLPFSSAWNPWTW